MRAKFKDESFLGKISKKITGSRIQVKEEGT